MNVITSDLRILGSRRHVECVENNASPTEFRSEFRVGEKQSDETRPVCDRTKEIHMDVIELIGSALELLGGTELLGTLLETGSAVLGLGQ